MRALFPRVAVIAVLVVALLASGAAAVWLWMTSDPPASLAAPRLATSAPVSYQDFSDRRAVTLRVESQPESRLESATGGRITSFACAPGATVESGTALVGIDGRPLVALATAVPLWRELALGDRGDDVTALQKELVRLGYVVTADGTVGRRTLAATITLFERAGDAAPDPERVEAARIVWIPAASVAFGECRASVGESHAAGDVLATTSGAITRVSVIEPIADLADSERRLTVDSVAVAVDETGSVDDASALAALAATPSFLRDDSAKATGRGGDAAEAENPGAIRGTLELATPVRVGVVPPSAVYAIKGSAGCVAAGDTALRVTIVGSQLGQTFVLFDAEQRPDTVLISDARRPTCT
ncbi:peptidoglycan-binding domain-containing protein [Leifsonia sp. L25]|uniref:peptidoglycan-binding domain-containing protein n=1 Tax=Actinomycetes TaxID=1760 RepID=UPI003D680361